MLNLSTRIFLRTGKKKKVRLDLVSWQLYIYPKMRNEGDCGETAMNECVKRKGAAASHLHTSLRFWRKQSRAFLCQLLVGLVLGMLIAAAEEMQTVWDESMRLQNAVAQGQRIAVGGMLKVQDQSHPRPTLEKDGSSVCLDNSPH